MTRATTDSPAPGTGTREERVERHADTSALDRQDWRVLRFVARKDYAVSTNDMIAEGMFEDTGPAGNAIRPIWENTEFLERAEIRQVRESDGGRQTAHVYWLTPVGKLAVQSLGPGH